MCNDVWWFPQDVSYPAQLRTSYLYFYWFLPCFPPRVFIRDSFRPSDVEDAPETGVIESMDPLQGCFRSPPGFRSRQTDGINVGVKDPQLGGIADAFRCPYVLSKENAVLTLPNLDLMSESVPPSLSTTLPR